MMSSDKEETMEKSRMVLVICALSKEYQALVNKLIEGKECQIAGIDGYRFPIPGGTAFAFQGRIGKVNTALDIGKLSQAVEITAIINSGVGGSISKDAKLLDVVVARRVAFYDVDLTAFGSPMGQMDGEPLWFETSDEILESVEELDKISDFNIKIGDIISGDRFVTKKNFGKKEIKPFGKPMVVDMESGAVAQCAHQLGVPFVIIRSISDNTNSSSNQSVYEEFLELAAKHASSVTLWLLRVIGEYLNTKSR